MAQLHARVWHETYRDMAPPEAIAAPDESRRLEQWHRSLAQPAPSGALLALCDGGLAGLVSYGAASHPAFAGRGEVKHLYIDAAQRGGGLGKRLLGLAIARLHRAGFARVGLAVVRGNTVARRFYTAQGGVEAGGFTDPGPLWRSDNLLVVWDGSDPAHHDG